MFFSRLRMGLLLLLLVVLLLLLGEMGVAGSSPGGVKGGAMEPAEWAVVGVWRKAAVLAKLAFSAKFCRNSLEAATFWRKWAAAAAEAARAAARN